MRITNHPILANTQRKPIKFMFNGIQIEGLEGDTIASALWVNKLKVIRFTEKYNEARSMFCGIGNCYECRVHVKNIGMVKACITQIKEGLIVFSSEQEQEYDEI